MIRRALALVVIGGLLLLVLPSAPVQLSYVYSDSMEPTISEGNGYVVVPAGDVEVGDVIVFESALREEYVTHRVVTVTDEGYVTQGDNNPSTDQAAGHPVVTEADVVGSALTIAGTTVSIPGFAWLVGIVSTYWPIGVLVLLLGGGVLERNPRSRDLVRIRDLMGPLVISVVLASAVALVYSAPTYSMSMVAVASETTDGGIVPVGESAIRTIEVATAPAFTYQFVEGNGVAIVDVIAQGEAAAVDVEVPPQQTAGGYTAAVTTYYYPAVLPYGVISALHAIHPLAAGLASIVTIVAPLYVLHWLVVDGAAPLEGRSRSRHAWWEFR